MQLDGASSNITLSNGAAAVASVALCARLCDPRVEAAPQKGAPWVVAGTYTHELPDAKAVEAFEKSL